MPDQAQFTYDSVMDATSTSESCENWCQSVGLVANQLKCPKCSNDMTLDVARERWRCNRSACPIERSIRVNSFFSKSRLPLRKLVRLLCHWAARSPVTSAADMVGVRPSAAAQWYVYCRDICSREMLTCPMQVGGVGHVEIDETSLSKSAKYGRGRRYPAEWLFGGVDRTTKKWFGILTHSDRTKPTLTALIKKHIKPG